MKVAVLDSGFRGYRDYLGKSLPERITVRSFRNDGDLEARNSQHGILCGEVLHALAPDAELLFANWEADEPRRFLEAVRWARASGARIISCSIIMPSWGDGEGGGAVHEQLGRVLGTGDRPGDVLFFSCAGNVAQRHWCGTFRAGQDGFHEWEPGQTANRLTPWENERVSVEVCWPRGADYDVTVDDQTSGAPAGCSKAPAAGGRGCAVVRFEPQAGHAYWLRVRLARGTPGPFHCTALHSGLQYATAQGSIPFPGDGPEVLTVGAVDYAGHRKAYSACGPNSKQPKPDFVAPGPFPSQCRAYPFAGTSAATPEAAGLTALLWCRHPDWTANRVRQVLRSSALDLGPPGHDCETGYGLIRLPCEGGKGI